MDGAGASPIHSFALEVIERLNQESMRVCKDWARAVNDAAMAQQSYLAENLAHGATRVRLAEVETTMNKELKLKYHECESSRQAVQQRDAIIRSITKELDDAKASLEEAKKPTHEKLVLEISVLRTLVISLKEDVSELESTLEKTNQIRRNEKKYFEQRLHAQKAKTSMSDWEELYNMKDAQTLFSTKKTNTSPARSWADEEEEERHREAAGEVALDNEAVCIVGEGIVAPPHHDSNESDDYSEA